MSMIPIIEKHLLAAVCEHPPDPDDPVGAARRQVPPVVAECDRPDNPAVRR